MKIEVTFDRNAKKHFKDECIKRLKNFVNEMKKHQGWKEATSPSLNKDDEMGSQKMEGEIKMDIQKQWEDVQSGRKGHRSMINTISRKMEEQSEVSKIAKLNKNKLESFSNFSQATRPSQSTTQVSVQQIRQNVNRIMQKLQKTNQQQTHENMQLKQQISDTNKKVDKIMLCLNDKQNIEEELKTEYIQSEEHIGQKQFDFKFNELTNRYNNIKFSQEGKGRQGKVRGRQSVFSMESTGDSMTFRRN